MKIIALGIVVLCLISSPSGAGVPQTNAATYKPGNGVVAPVVIKEVKPLYPSAAKDAGIEGTVALECVVLADGSVAEVHVTKPLDSALDQEAIKAVKQWRFKPGTKDGQAVRVQVVVELTFKLASGAGQPLFPVRAVGEAAVQTTARTDDVTVFTPGTGVVAPRLLKDTKPQYTAAARAAGIQGTVLLECVVLADGSVGEVRVTRSLDEALDEEAIKAIRQWRFEPGTKDGKAVRVRVSAEMTFSLR